MKRKNILNFNVVFELEKRGGFSVYVPSLPGCVTEGKNFEHAQRMAKEAILVYLEELASRKEDVPEDTGLSPMVGMVAVDLADVRA